MTESVQFGGMKLMGITGMLAGVVIAVGVPSIMLLYGPVANLGGTAISLLSALGIIGGTVVTAIAAFFSIAIPSRVTKTRSFLEQKARPQPAQ